MMVSSSLLALATGCSLAAAQTFTNPIIWQDLADLELIRVNDTFYYTASTMHYSPGAPVLRSYNLHEWEMIGHSVPELTFGDKYNLDGSGRAYVNGIWASSMAYRESNGLYYWYGCIDFATTYIFTASDPAGPWEQQPSIQECYYDVGVLVDEDDTMYLASGKYDIAVTQLSEDGFSPVRTELVWQDSERYLEGARFYNINGRYYIWLTKPADEQHVLIADAPFGTYQTHSVLERMGSPIPSSGTPHQGSLIDTPNGDWYYTAFLDAYPLGRIPVLAPITFDDQGVPTVVTDANGAWASSYPVPDIQADKSVTPIGPYTTNFDSAPLGAEWEWNHNPDNSAWDIGGGLTLRTATVTTDLYAARNTLSHRIVGPKSSATIRLNLAGMASGDIAGIALLRDESAYLGVRKASDGSLTLQAVYDITMVDQDGAWQTRSEGNVVASSTSGLEGVTSGDADIWLRLTADATPTFGVDNAGRNPAIFEWSTDGETWSQLGETYNLHNRWQFFMAFRFAIFNFATEALGGEALVKEFSLQLA